MSDALRFCAVLIGFVGGSQLEVALLARTDLVVALFVPAGVTTGVLLLSPTRRWGIVFAAVVAGQSFVSFQAETAPDWRLLVLTAANVAGPAVGAGLVRWHRERIDLTRVDDLLVFLVGAGIAGPLAGGVLGAGAIWSEGEHTISNTLAAWFLGHSLAVIVVGGLILSVALVRRQPVSWTEFIAEFTFTGLVAVAAHLTTDVAIEFVTIVPLMIVSIRAGMTGASGACALITAIAVASWLGTGSPPATATLDGTSLEMLQLLTMSAAAMVVAAEAAELARALRQAGYQRETAEVLRLALAPEPEVSSQHANAEGISLAASDRLAVGGDWYDIVESADGVVAIVIGDAVGHDQDALILMGKLRHAAQAFVMVDRDSGRVLDRLAEYATRFGHGAYATCFVAFFDSATGWLDYASAGHPPGLLGSEAGPWRWLSEGGSPPIGVRTAEPRPSAQLRLEVDSTLVVYTDGVVERAGQVIDTGLARMFDAVVEHPDEAVSDLLNLMASPRADDASFVRVQLRRDAEPAAR